MDSAQHAVRTMNLRSEPNYFAPDGSEIRVLITMEGGGLAHCTLPPGGTSRPVRHQRVEEIWYVLEGDGEVWREDEKDPVRVRPGSCLAIVPRKAFQFRNVGDGPLRILISTMPSWPGKHEALDANGPWGVELDANGD